jgi:DNA-binding transcriptional MerR regulator
MRIGELSKRAGVSTSKLRFYEARGVLLPAGAPRMGIATTAITHWRS